MKKPVLQESELIVLSNQDEFKEIKFVKNIIISRENIYFWNQQQVYKFNHTVREHSGFLNIFKSNSSPIKPISFKIP